MIAELKQDDPTAGVYDSDDERRRLQEILEPFYRSILAAVNALMLDAFSDFLDPATFVVDDPATNRVLADAAARVVRIDETTRRAIAEQLQVGHARGYSTFQIAHGVPSDGYAGINGLFRENWRGRAEMVARTELQHAQVVSARERYAASGIVDRVEIIDGDEWDATCRNRNGTVVPLEQAPDLAHPNCTLVLVPVLRADVAPGP